jgi:hypothetical protein
MEKDSCIKADYIFLMWAKCLLKNHSYVSNMNVFVNEANEPVLLEKDHDIRSAILLKDAMVSGMFLPAGSLVVIDRQVKGQYRGKKRLRSGFGYKMPLSVIKGISFLRFSVLVVDGVERNTYFKKQMGEYSKKNDPNLPTDLTLAQLLSLAEAEVN